MHLRRLCAILLALCCLSPETLAPVARAYPVLPSIPVGYVGVTASNLSDSTGTLVANATISFAPVANNGAPISYRISGHGQSIQSPVTATVTNGVFVIQLADTALTAPINLCYNVTVTDNVSGNSILGPGYTCVQPAGSGTAVTGSQSWCTAAGTAGGTCNFDNYTPNLAALVQTQYGPPGPAPTLIAGTATPLAAGATPTVSVSGTNPYAINFGIPAGVTGAPGSAFNPLFGTTTPAAPCSSTVNTGLFYTNTTANTLYQCTGTAWVSVGGSGGSLPAGVSGNGANGLTITGTPSASTDAATVAYVLANASAGATGAAGPAGAAVVSPDSLAAPVTAYATQATPIAAVTDANAKTALTTINNTLLSLQAALQNNGIIIPNTLQAALAGCATCGYWALNPTGAALGPATVSNTIPNGTAVTFAQTLVTGALNYNPGGRGPGQNSLGQGWVQTGGCGSNFNVIPTGMTTIPGASALAMCAAYATSTSQIQGGGTLTNSTFPQYKASTTAYGTLNGAATGMTISVVSNDLDYYAPSGHSVKSANPPLSKINEWNLGNGTCGKYNTGTSAYVSWSITAANIFSRSGYTYGWDSWNRTTLVDYGNGTFQCFFNDGYGAGYSSSILTASTTVTSVQAVAVSGAAAQTQSVLILPGIQMTQAQVAGLSCGFTSTGSCGNGWQLAANAITANPYTSLSSQPGADWVTTPITTGSAYLRDCPYFVPYTNGGASGTVAYNGVWSHCRMLGTSNGPSVRFGYMFNSAPINGAGVTAKVDGVLAISASGQSSNGTSYIDVALPNDGAYHVAELDLGMQAGSSPPFTAAQLYSLMNGAEPVSIAIPNNQQYQLKPVTQTGTTAICITDSILCTGFYVTSGGTPASSASFVPMYRSATGAPTNNIVGLGAGSYTLYMDFNVPTTANVITTAGGGSGFPTTAASTYVTTYVAPLATGGTASNVTTALIARGINDYGHASTIYASTQNCIGAEAYSLKNALAALRAYNGSMTIHLFSLLNSGAYNETGNDFCSGDSYTTTTTLTAQEYIGGVWTPTSVPAGTVFSGATQKWQWRAMQQDICLTLGSCDYFEVGPGSPGITVGSFTYYAPDLSNGLGSYNPTVPAGGTGYAVGDKLYPTQTGVTGGWYNVLTAPGGVVGTVQLGQSGHGYSVGTANATTTSGSGTGATLTFPAQEYNFSGDNLHLSDLGHYAMCQYFSAKYTAGAMTCKIQN